MDFLNNPNNEFKITKYWGEMINFVQDLREFVIT